jgi:uncharacterized protein (UPF0261 family)
MKKTRVKIILIIGTLDTKKEEIFYAEKIIKKRGFNVIIMDTSAMILSNNINPQMTSSEIVNLVSKHSTQSMHLAKKEKYINIVNKIGRALITSFYNDGKIDAVLGIGGGTGTSIGTAIMQILPRGFPKLIVSTIATGTTQCGPLIGTNDITLMHSVVDLQGINFFTARILSNAVGAICGMAEIYREEEIEDYNKGKILIAMSMMGTTTTGALKAKKIFEENGFQVISFHQNGTGGIAMEEMIGENVFQGVFDLSLHEVGDRELGGLHGAVKPIRLETAGKKGIPQVVAPGCLVYYVAGPVDSLAPEIRKRKYFVHSPQLTLVRATPQELTHIGKVVAKKLNLAKGPLKVFIPLKGFCAPDKEGSELFDPEGNTAFINSLKKDLDKHIPIVEVDAHINDSEFINVAAGEFIKMMEKTRNILKTKP